MKKLFGSLLLALLLLPCGAGIALGGEELGGTLAKIKKDGVIIVGHRESSVPFSYYDSAQNVVGYAQDYSKLIVEAVKKKLGVSELTVKLVPITSQNRIPLLANGTYDFECGSTTNNLERQQQVAFSNTFFIIGTRLLVHKDSKITDFSDLKGRRVVVTAGTTSEKLLFLMNDRDKMNVQIISTPTHGDSFRSLESGRAEAFFLDDVLLAGERSRARNPSDWVIVGTPQSYEAYGCMLRKDDPQFKALVDETIASAQLSGLAESSYEQWFKKPIPPRGAIMNFDLSEAMKDLLRNPNDKAFQ
ncbi:MAG: glutamate/aspartate ABC transporter substrate-binding protein [Deltaproteobacteria bacterium]|nr:glutamate/aspartate ABC transporter substrate-binding protein [Deltaproteobacteria bacterium]